MENATKALLIAAAILIAIIIISLGIAVVTKGQESVNNIDLSDAEAAAFNAKFKAYEGANVSTSDVNAMVSAVISHNQNNPDNKITITDSTENTALDLVGDNAAYTGFTKLTGAKRYTVKCTYTNGLISTIEVDEK